MECKSQLNWKGSYFKLVSWEPMVMPPSLANVQLDPNDEQTDSKQNSLQNESWLPFYSQSQFYSPPTEDKLEG